MDTHIKEKIDAIPNTPGVYFFKNKEGIILYVGKAKDLKRRVKQYVASPQSLTEKTRTLVSQVTDIAVESVRTEFEALLLETKYIRLHQPKYNIIAKDDKSPIYISINTHEDAPRVLLARKEKIKHTKSTVKLFGPFPSVRIATQLLYALRQTFPYCTQKIRNGKPCFYAHLGLCSPCPSFFEKMEDTPEKVKERHIYRKNISRLIAVLSGNMPNILEQMRKEMEQHAKKEQFEEAQKMKIQINSLLKLYQTSYEPFQFEHAESIETIVNNELENFISILTPYIPITNLKRIECVDISNTGGKEAVGSLVVCTNGLMNKKEYRRFRIKSIKESNDVGMIEEVLQRRIAHPEWQFPNLLIVDGGKPQVRKASQLFQKLNISIPVIGLAKRQEEIIFYEKNTFITLRIPLHKPAMHLIQRIRDEAHRFAITYHKKLRNKIFFTAN